MSLNTDPPGTDAAAGNARWGTVVIVLVVVIIAIVIGYVIGGSPAPAPQPVGIRQTAIGTTQTAPNDAAGAGGATSAGAGQ